MGMEIGGQSNWAQVGSLAIAAIGLAGTIWLGSRGIYKFWKKRRPLTVRIYDEGPYLPRPIERVPRPFFRGSIGTQTVNLCVDTDEEVILAAFNVRLLDGPWFGEKAADRDAVEIVSVEAKEWEKEKLTTKGRNRKAVTSDEYGSLTVKYADAVPWKIDQPLWVSVEINAKRPWRGRISFRTETDRRVRARCRAYFT